MIMMPLVSVIIPNYNNDQYLADCIRSVLEQTYSELEIIVIDDCSTDRSVDIVLEMTREDSRVRLLKNPTNQGVARTRHRGFEQSLGRLVSTLDSDDLLGHL